MERITGYAAGDVVGKTCNLIQCNTCFGKKCPEGINACGILDHGGEELKECSLRHRDGFEVPVIKNAAVIWDKKKNILDVALLIAEACRQGKFIIAGMDIMEFNMHFLGIEMPDGTKDTTLDLVKEFLTLVT